MPSLISLAGMHAQGAPRSEGKSGRAMLVDRSGLIERNAAVSGHAYLHLFGYLDGQFTGTGGRVGGGRRREDSAIVTLYCALAPPVHLIRTSVSSAATAA